MVPAVAVQLGRHRRLLITSTEPQLYVVPGLCRSLQAQTPTGPGGCLCSLFPVCFSPSTWWVCPHHPAEPPVPLCGPGLGSPAASFSSGSLGPERGRKVRPEVGWCLLPGPGPAQRVESQGYPPAPIPSTFLKPDREPSALPLHFCTQGNDRGPNPMLAIGGGR